MARNKFCVGCGHNFYRGFNGSFGETIFHSSIYGASNDDILCERCSLAEEIQIDETGSNYIPSLLEIYQTTLWNQKKGEY